MNDTNRINNLFTWLVGILILTLTASAFFYGEPFDAWNYALSWLGGIRTINGFPNTFGMLVFSMGMIMSGIVMLKLGGSCKPDAVNGGSRLKAVLCYTAAAGFLIIIFPWDVFDPIHMSGSALMFGSLWGIANISLLKKKLAESVGQSVSIVRIRIGRFILFLVLNGSVIAYAVGYVLNSAVKQPLQKFAVVGLSLTLKLLHRGMRENRPREDVLIRNPR